MPTQLKWKCPNCGIAVKISKGHLSVTCSCGLIQHPDDRVLFGTTAADAMIPHWEIHWRQNECLTCGHHSDGRCFHKGLKLDAGCRSSHNKRLRDPFGACPDKRWVRSTIRFVRTSELVAAAQQLVELLPPDVTRIVGIPRSGMIPAAIVATARHLPLFTIRDFQVVPVGGGSRTQWGRLDPGPGRAAFIDDTIHNGGTVQLLRERGVDIGGGILGVCFALDRSLADLAVEDLPTPHLLEWNLFNTPWGQIMACDLDGVICHNPPHQKRPRYLLRHMPAKAIITARPEAERVLTEAWLARWGVKYQQLIMWDGSEADRWNVESVARWKSHQVAAVGAEFYVESEPEIANAMRACGCRTLCPDQGFLQ